MAEVPAVSGCLAQGETLEELKLVQTLCLEASVKYGQPFPKPDEA
ncbi:type II toxin-antitoxin system HicB family antitoxin [Pseudocalidococcus azoricus]